MRPIQLIIALCAIYGVHCTTIRVGHKPASAFQTTEVIAEASAPSSGPFVLLDPYIRPFKSSIQKATVALCHSSGGCREHPRDLLNRPPFVNLLGPYQYHESHTSPLAFLNDLNPVQILSQALHDFKEGVHKAEADVVFAPVRSLADAFKGIFAG